MSRCHLLIYPSVEVFFLDEVKVLEQSKGDAAHVKNGLNSDNLEERKKPRPTHSKGKLTYNLAPTRSAICSRVGNLPYGPKMSY